MSGAPGRPAAAAAGGGQGAPDVKAVRAQLDLMEQDSARVCAGDYATPFASLEDAVDRLLPYHMFGAEDPQQTDAREAEAVAGGDARLATSRSEAWQAYAAHRVNEAGAALMALERKIGQAEAGALQRSQLPLLMLQSYATAEAQALAAGERQRRIDAERAAAERTQKALLEQQRKQQEALAAQMAQQQAAAAQQQQLAQQAAAQQQMAQQQMAAPSQAQVPQVPPPAGGMQQAAGVSMAQQQAAQQQQWGQQPPGGVQPMYAAPGPPGPGMPAAQQPRPPAQPQAPAAPAAKPLSAAEQKAAQLAALKARISQRK